MRIHESAASDSRLSYTGKAGEYLVRAGGTIDASLLLVDEITRDPRIKLKGEPLAAVSDRDSFWVAGDANPYAVFSVAARVAGGDLVMVVASALKADARSVYRLFAKLDAYLREINSVAYRDEFGQASSESTAIIVKLHPDTDPVIAKLLSSYAKRVEGRNARLMLEELAIDG